MNEQFKRIPGFPHYVVSDLGRVINKRFDREMTRSHNAYGDPSVGMIGADNIQKRRTVKLLVADAFVERLGYPFDTPIVLDGDRENLVASNIVWRPRWFAIEYIRQFDMYLQDGWWFAGPVINETTGDFYESIVDAAIATGSLVRYIRAGIMERKPVFPTGYTFKFL
jgi:hypothetical protein